MEKVFLFVLLVFWIPLGSAPRCNTLAYAAFQEFGLGMSLWQYSGLYSILVFLCALNKKYVLDLLGYIITPLLLISIGALAYSSYTLPFPPPSETSETVPTFFSALTAGYNTQDFIAAFFFTGVIIDLIHSKGSKEVPRSLILKSSLLGVSLISAVYIGMIFSGYIHGELLAGASKDLLLVRLATGLKSSGLDWVIISAITLSCLSTSVALSVVFANYLYRSIFHKRLAYQTCLFISIGQSYIVSTLGFETLASVIGSAMGAMYPLLLIVSIFAWNANKTGHSNSNKNLWAYSPQIT